MTGSLTAAQSWLFFQEREKKPLAVLEKAGRSQFSIFKRWSLFKFFFKKVKVAFVCFCRAFFVFGSELATYQSSKTFVSGSDQDNKSKRFPNKDLLLSRLLESKNGNQIWNDKMIVYIIIIAAFQTHYNINIDDLSKGRLHHSNIQGDVCNWWLLEKLKHEQHKLGDLDRPRYT